MEVKEEEGAEERIELVVASPTAELPPLRRLRDAPYKFKAIIFEDGIVLEDEESIIVPSDAVSLPDVYMAIPDNYVVMFYRTREKRRMVAIAIPKKELPPAFFKATPKPAAFIRYYLEHWLRTH